MIMKKNKLMMFCMKAGLFASILSLGVIYTKLDEARCDKKIYNTLSEKHNDINDTEKDDELASIIRSSFKKKITFDIDVYPVLSKASLQIAYDRNLVLEGRGDDYSLIIKGEDIEDYNNELDMAIDIKKISEKVRNIKDGYVITRKSDNELPGKVMIKIRNKKFFRNNVYIHNKKKGSYDLLDVNDMTWMMDKDMTYLITNKNLNEKKIDYNILIYISIGIAVLMIIYVLVKKKYWFW